MKIKQKQEKPSSRNKAEIIFNKFEEIFILKPQVV
jgi:hypothetical protein